MSKPSQAVFQEALSIRRLRIDDWDRILIEDANNGELSQFGQACYRLAETLMVLHERKYYPQIAWWRIEAVYTCVQCAELHEFRFWVQCSRRCVNIAATRQQFIIATWQSNRIMVKECSLMLCFCITGHNIDHGYRLVMQTMSNSSKSTHMTNYLLQIFLIHTCIYDMRAPVLYHCTTSRRCRGT